MYAEPVLKRDAVVISMVTLIPRMLLMRVAVLIVIRSANSCVIVISSRHLRLIKDISSEACNKVVVPLYPRYQSRVSATCQYPSSLALKGTPSYRLESSSPRVHCMMFFK